MGNSLGIIGGIILLISIIGFIGSLVALIAQVATKKSKKFSLIGIGSFIGVFIIGCIFVFSGYSIAQTNTGNQTSADTSSDTGYDSSSYTTNDTPISKNQYNKINLGMTESQLKQIIPNMDSNNIADDGTTADWMFINDDGGSADIYLDDYSHKVTKKEEQGVLSENSDTYTDKAGTHKNKDTGLSNDNSSSDSNVNVDDTLNSKIRSAAKPQLGKIEKVEINDDMGKNDGGKIVLIHVKSDDIDKRLAQYQTSIVMRNEFKISKVNEVVVFWDADLISQSGKQFVGEVAKIGLTKDVAKKITWDSFDYTQYPNITKDYYMSHLLK